jgi:alkanesulfonate monooxygenase SsuD/methylene tetrahydromethanopterin reductase-like flavin-dependent oxidoreductase (luciferase family)
MPESITSAFLNGSRARLHIQTMSLARVAIAFDHHTEETLEMKFALHYSLQALDRNWRQLYSDTLQQIVLAEKMGFNAVFVAEHHFLDDGWIPCPTLVCSAIAMVTKKMRIGTDIMILPLYHPLRVAEASAVLDILSNGRFILGVGIGASKGEYEQFGVSTKQRSSRMEEFIPLIRRLLSEEKVTHSCRFCSFKDVTVTPRPIQKPSPPLWVAALDEPAVRRAARLGDAWIPANMQSDAVVKERLKAYKESLREAGKDYAQLEKPIRREAYVADDADRAWEECKDALIYEYGNIYYKMGALRDENGRLIDFGSANFDDMVDLVKKRFIIGSPDDLISEAERYEREFDRDLLILRLQAPGLENEKVLRAIKIIGEKVIPYFQ